MVSISKYRQEYKDGKIFICANEKSVCPVCQSELRVIGSKHRKAIDPKGEWQTFVIRRLRCEACKLIHHELPDIFIPYKRHCAETVEKIATNENESATRSPTTISRIKQWWEVIRNYFVYFAACLAAKCDLRAPTHLTPAIIVRAMANTHSWVHTRSAWMSAPQTDTA